ncbi:rolling circle replication-associated protein [Clostridium tunisiense]|uniref:rolling circle replication-associated protein n=1 Tax=Clostridium tunisiense TaxID=219748 RepID=UPI0003137B3E|nr:hypothetical protein [Clostridium tunisiense]
MPYREKRFYTGNTLEVDIFPISFKEKRKSRKEKKKLSSLKQKNLNDKNAIRNLIRLINTNFTDADLAVHLTFDDKHLPATEEEAKKVRDNYILRIRRYRKKNGLPPIKYIIVYEYSEEEENSKGVRKHFHIIMSGMDRDTVEKLWGKGWANADRLQANEFGYEALARYVAKKPRGEKRWQPSRNLEKPKVEVNDTDFNRRKVEKIAKCPEDREFFEKRYKGYVFTQCEVAWNQETSRYYLYIKMRKIRN